MSPLPTLSCSGLCGVPWELSGSLCRNHPPPRHHCTLAAGLSHHVRPETRDLGFRTLALVGLSSRPSSYTSPLLLPPCTLHLPINVSQSFPASTHLSCPPHASAFTTAFSRPPALPFLTYWELPQYDSSLSDLWHPFLCPGFM